MRKAQLTREIILRQAYEIASREGLEGLSFGALADRLNMSKSGVYVHFGSIESLRLSVLRSYRERFEQDVLRPARLVPDGLRRFQAIFFHCVHHISSHREGGMFYLSCAAEYDDRSGDVRDELVKCVTEFRETLFDAIQSAIRLGELKSDSDPRQVVFDVYGLLLLLQHEMRLLALPDAAQRVQLSFTRLLQSQVPDGFRSHAITFDASEFLQYQERCNSRSHTKWEACCATLASLKG